MNVFDALKEIGGSQIVFNVLNSYMLYYNKYYGINENMFSKSNHPMELFMEYIDEYKDNLKTIHTNKPPIELGEYYTLYYDDKEVYYAKSCIVLLLQVVKENKMYDNWNIEFSED